MLGIEEECSVGSDEGGRGGEGRGGEGRGGEGRGGEGRGGEGRGGEGRRGEERGGGGGGGGGEGRGRRGEGEERGREGVLQSINTRQIHCYKLLFEVWGAYIYESQNSE